MALSALNRRLALDAARCAAREPLGAARRTHRAATSVFLATADPEQLPNHGREFCLVHAAVTARILQGVEQTRQGRCGQLGDMSLLGDMSCPAAGTAPGMRTYALASGLAPTPRTLATTVLMADAGSVKGRPAFLVTIWGGRNIQGRGAPGPGTGSVLAGRHARAPALRPHCASPDAAPPAVADGAPAAAACMHMGAHAHCACVGTRGRMRAHAPPCEWVCMHARSHAPRGRPPALPARESPTCPIGGPKGLLARVAQCPGVRQSSRADAGMQCALERENARAHERRAATLSNWLKPMATTLSIMESPIRPCVRDGGEGAIGGRERRVRGRGAASRAHASRPWVAGGARI